MNKAKLDKLVEEHKSEGGEVVTEPSEDKTEVTELSKWAQRISDLHEENAGWSKDELFDHLYGEGLRGLSKFTTYLKESGVKFGKSGGRGWRQVSVDLIIEAEGEITLKEWQARMAQDSEGNDTEVKGDRLLASTTNYNHLFPMMVALYNRKSF